jgi:hypothetical protein
MLPDNLTREELVKQNVTLTAKLKIHNGEENDIEKLLQRVAHYLRDEVKEFVRKQPWRHCLRN